MGKPNADVESVNRAWLRGVYVLGVFILVLAVGCALLLSWSQAQKIREVQDALAATRPVQVATSQRMDIIARVEGFYDRAWGKLILVMVVGAGIVTGIVGVLVPLLIQHYQRQLFRKDTERLEARIDEKFDAIDSKVHTSICQLNHYAAIFWSEMAKTEWTSSAAWDKALQHWAYAIDSALQAAWPAADSRWQTALLDHVPMWQSELTDASIGAVDEVRGWHEARMALRQTLYKLKTRPQEWPYTELIASIQWVLSLEPPKEDDDAGASQADDSDDKGQNDAG